MTTNTKAKTASTMKTTASKGSSLKLREASIDDLDYDPRRGRPLKSAAEAQAAMAKNRKEASKAAKRGWMTRRRREREIGIAAANAARDDR